MRESSEEVPVCWQAPMTDVIDDLDAELIAALRGNARLPYSVLSTKLGLTAITTRRRLEHLIEEGVVSLELIPDPEKLGYHTEVFIGLHVDLAHIRTALGQLSSKSPVAYATLTAGRYDILLWAFFRSPHHLAAFIEKDLGSVAGVRSSETLTTLKVGKGPWDPLLGTSADRPASRKVDDLDWRILSCLSFDPRMPLTTLAHRAHISATTARERVERMLREAVVLPSAVANPLKTGYQILAHIGLNVRIPTLTQVQRRLASIPAIRGIAMTAGRYDIIARAQFHLHQELDDFVQSELASIEGIERSEMLLNIHIAKQTFRTLYDGPCDAITG